MKMHSAQKGNILIILTLLVVGAAVILGYLYFKTQPTAQSLETQITGEAGVAITRSGFIPATITVKKGTQITWTSRDKAPHRVISDQLPNLDSEESLNENDSFSYIFETSGTFTYHDEENPVKFTGTVIVE